MPHQNCGVIVDKVAQQDTLFSFVHEDRGSVTYLALQGQLDARTANTLKEIIHTLVQANTKRLALDLSGLQTLDSSGMGGVVSLIGRLHTAGGKVRVFGLQGQPKELFTALNMHKAFDLVDDLDQAIKALSK